MSFRMCILFSLLAFTAVSAATPPALPDQYGVSASLDDYAGKPVLVIVAAGRKLRWIGKWEQALRAELPGLESLRVAAIRDQPPPSEEKVATMLRARVPPGVSILIDLQNAWATTYALDPTEPCLLVFDSEHNVVAQFQGRPGEPLLTEVLTALRPYFPAPSSP
jgi:hypothetical protein